MRKTFVKILAVALSLLAMSSCGKIWDEFDSVNKELASLSDRIDELNAKLNNEVAALNEAIGTINGAIKDLQDDTKELAAELAEAGVEIEALKNADSNNLKEIQDALTQAQDEILAQLKNLSDADAAQAAKLSELSDKITALQGELDAAVAKIAVTGVEEKDGVVVLTLANGETITVSPSSNTDNTGLVTTILVDGVEYWAVVKEDGTVESLGIPVGHPDVTVEFMVDYETKELLYSVNGGDFMPTGAYVADLDYYLVTDVINEDDYVIITIGVGEYAVEYILPKYKEDNSTLIIKAGKTVFAYEETKEFDLSSADLAETYVMSKPDGWKAALDGTKLIVTAPAEANVYAEQEGDVLLHGNTADGKCKIAKLSVTVKETGFTMEILYNATFDYNDWGEVITYEGVDAVRIVNSQVMTTTNMWGETFTDFANFYFGLAPIEAFEANPSEYLTNQIVNYGMDISFMWNNMYGDTYVAEEYEDWDGTIVPACTVSDKTVAISKIYTDATYGEEMPAGSQWVVWACPVDEAGAPIVDEVSYIYYEPVYINIQAVETTHNDIKLNITQVGADYFQVGKFVNNPDSRDYMNLEEQMYYFQEYGAEMGMVDETKGTYEIWLSEFAEYIEEGVEVDKLVPGSEYLVYVFPFKNGKAASEYVYETDFAPYIFTFSTAPLTADGTTEVTGVLNETRTTINQIAVDLTATEGTETVYWNFYTQAEIDEFETEADILASVLADGTPSTGNVMTVQTPNSYPSIQPEEVRILVAVAVDAEGRYKSLYQEEFAADSIPYSADITVAVESVEFTSDDLKNVTVVYNVTGADYLVLKASSSKPSLQNNTTQGASMVNNLLLNGADYYQFSTVEVVDGKATVNFTNYSTSGYYKYVYSYAIACNLNEDKDVESMAEILISDLRAYEPVVEETPAE